jgi:hypothetical protein
VAEQTHKTCPDCHRHLPLEEFPKRGKRSRKTKQATGYLPYCRECHQVRNRKYKAKRRALLAEARYKGVQPQNEREEMIYRVGKEHGLAMRAVELADLQEEIQTLRHLLQQAL